MFESLNCSEENSKEENSKEENSKEENSTEDIFYVDLFNSPISKSNRLFTMEEISDIYETNNERMDFIEKSRYKLNNLIKLNDDQILIKKELDKIEDIVTKEDFIQLNLLFEKTIGNIDFDDLENLIKQNHQKYSELIRNIEDIENDQNIQKIIAKINKYISLINKVKNLADSY